MRLPFTLAPLLSSLLCLSSFATTTHTLHNVTANAKANCQFSAAYENQFYFVDKSGASITTFTLEPNVPYQFGLVLSGGADFNMEYTMVCVADTGAFAKRPRVTYVIGANGPADPDVKVVNDYGAEGSWKVIPGVGEDFSMKLQN